MADNVDLADLALAKWEADEEKAFQEAVVLARDYYGGNQHVKLSDRQKEFLGFEQDGRFAINLCRMIVNAVTERMIVSNLESPESNKSGWAWKVWEQNRLESLQQEIYTAAVRDGEFFVFTTWDAGLERIRFVPHRRYTDPLVQGDGFGCKVFYEQDDPTLPARFATKRWTQRVYDNESKKFKRYRRMNVYYNNRIEKYIIGSSTKKEWGWVPYKDGGEWPIPWVSDNGEPLGIPIIQFSNPDNITELWDAIPIQDAINKASVDLIASVDAAGFPVRLTPGFYLTTDGKAPEDDGGNYVELTPGAFLFVPEGKTIEDLEIPNLKPMIDVLDAWILRLGQVTDTPLSRFQVTRQVRSEMTLKQEEAPLLARIKARQARFGSSWERAFAVASRLQNEYGGTDKVTEAELNVIWDAAETKDAKQEIDIITQKVEGLGIPLTQAWKEAGYSEEEIQSFTSSPEYQTRIKLMEIDFNAEAPDPLEATTGGEAEKKVEGV
jgi:hypothetical protein